MPHPHDIPFHEFMDLPTPFSNDVLREFAICHVPHMTAASFLEDSEWCGYYSLSDRTPLQYFGSGQISFDPPMYDINFSVDRSEDSNQKKGVLNVTGTGGMDGVGTFTLSGTIDTKDGTLSMVKAYDNDGLSWNWRGVLTPLGLVAQWGEPDWGGWVWMWKATWCPR